MLKQFENDSPKWHIINISRFHLLWYCGFPLFFACYDIITHSLPHKLCNIRFHFFWQTKETLSWRCNQVLIHKLNESEITNNIYFVFKQTLWIKCNSKRKVNSRYKWKKKERVGKRAFLSTLKRFWVVDVETDEWSKRLVITHN